MSEPSYAQLIFQWSAAKLALHHAKKAEIRWRLVIANKLFPNAVKGSNVFGKLTLTVKQNFKPIEASRELETFLWAYKEQYADVQIDNLISFKAFVSPSAYANLSAEAQQALAPILTITNATPALALKGLKLEDDAE